MGRTDPVAMNIRHLLTGAALVGALSVGAAGVAVATTSTTPPTPGSAPAACPKGATRLQIATDLDNAAGLRLSLLQQALASAQAKGNTTRVGKIQDRITKLSARKQKLEARMQALEQRCGLSP